MRKSLSFIAFICFLFVANVKGQQTFVVNEIYSYMSKGQQTGFEIPIQEAKPDEALDNFEKFMKKYKGKTTSPSKKNPEGFIDNAMIKEVSPNYVDLYYTAQATEYGSKILVYVDLGGAFLGSQSHPSQFGVMQNLLKEVGRQQAIVIADSQVKAEEKVLEGLEKEIKDLAEDKANHIKEIEKANALIAQREQDIISNDQNQATKQQQIEIQKTIVQTVKDKRSALGK